MADEIRVTSRIESDDNNVQIREASQTFDQAATGRDYRMHTIGTSEESITLTDINTEGWCRMKNTDDTNYVEWGFSTGVYGGRMEPGEPAGPFRLNPGATLFFKADTAACKVDVLVLED